MVRTTIDLPSDLHTVALSLARDRHQSLSRTVADLMRRGLEGGAPSGRTGSRNGLPTVRLGTGPITAEDVRRLDDE